MKNTPLEASAEGLQNLGFPYSQASSASQSRVHSQSIKGNELLMPVLSLLPS